MVQVSVTINARKYQIACDDGQEAHLTRLGAYVDKRISELVAAVGQVGDARLLVMVSLLVADELSDAYAELDAVKATGGSAAVRLRADESMSSRIESLARKIDDIAQTLEEA